MGQNEAVARILSDSPAGTVISYGAMANFFCSAFQYRESCAHLVLGYKLKRLIRLIQLLCLEESKLKQHDNDPQKTFAVLMHLIKRIHLTFLLTCTGLISSPYDSRSSSISSSACCLARR